MLCREGGGKGFEGGRKKGGKKLSGYSNNWDGVSERKTPQSLCASVLLDKSVLPFPPPKKALCTALVDIKIPRSYVGSILTLCVTLIP